MTDTGVQRRGDEALLITGVTVSYVGSAVATVLFPVAAVAEFDATPFQVSVIIAGATVPGLLLRYPLGRRADISRRKLEITIGADLFRFVLTVAVPALWLVGLLNVGILIAVSLAVGVGSVVHSAFMPATLPTVVRAERLPTVNGWMASAESAADVVGTALGALLLKVLSAPVGILVDSGSYLVSASTKIAILRRRGGDRVQVPTAEDGGSSGSSLPGFLRGLLPWLVLLSLANGLILAVLIFLTREAGFSSTVYGLILSAGALGAVLGGPLAGLMLGRFGPRTVVTFSLTLMATGTILTSTLAVPVRVALVPIAGEFLGGLGAVTLIVCSISVIQQTGSAIGASVAALLLAVDLGAVVGTLAGGAAAELVGLSAVALTASVISVGGVLGWSTRTVRVFGRGDD